jgi:thioredoxin-dependent peroxiredoxin
MKMHTQSKTGMALLQKVTAVSLLPVLLAAAEAGAPSVGEKAQDFALSTLEGKSVRLSDLTSASPVVLVVLRGYPGYQCPFCNRQVQDLIGNAQGFADAGYRVLMVYPGPSQDLNAKASGFVASKKLPATFDLLLDPDYVFTALYGLRWNAPGETAYPSTFLINRQGVVTFRKVAKEHGGRSTAAQLLTAIQEQSRNRQQ